MAFIDTIQDWTGDNFEDGMKDVYVSKLKDVLDTLNTVIDDGN